MDFEDAGYDAADVLRHDILQECLALIISRAEACINATEVSRQTKADAISAVLENALVAVDMIYIERDAASVSATSKTNASWVPEDAPPSCSMDTWLRAAIPEEHRGQSFAMDQFLRKPNPTLSRGSSMAPSRPTTGAKRTPELATPLSPNSLSRSATRMSTSPSSRTRGASPDVKSTDKRLREELEIRRAQASIARDLEAKDAAEKERLATLQRQLKGRDYSYDHKGQVVVLAPHSEAAPVQEGGSSYRLATPELPGASPAAGRKDGASAKHKQEPARRSLSRGNTRRLVNDFREIKPTTQPNALDVLHPTMGVMLRQGAQTKSGPAKPAVQRGSSAQGMTRDDYAKVVAAKQHQEAAARPRERESQGMTPPQGATHDAAAAAADAIARAARAGAPPNSAGLLAALPDVPPMSAGAKLRPPPAMQAAGGRPAAGAGPDVSLLLVSAKDWGVPGSQRAYSPPASLPFVKPDEKQREMEVGRTVKLPRDRNGPGPGPPAKLAPLGRVRS